MSPPRKKKKFGQHHLRDGSLCRPAVGYLQPLEGVGVVEIGPGGGVLTKQLLEGGAGSVLGLELDMEWAAELESRAWPGLELWVGDALDYDWSSVEARDRIAGNLPYNVASPLMERILDHGAAGTRCAFLVQREMADRWCAVAGESDYGSFSVLMAARCIERRRLSKVKAGSFDPPPKVESAFVGLELGPPTEEVVPWTLFKETVRAAFQQRRKTVLNSLASTWGKEVARSLLDAASIDPGTRAERLVLADFERLSFERARLREVR
ncbi:MAG: 16S rRNA (adenine(1518)-N(6)/adenine(1519)-N(6))-dimethyltransferase RsmA [Acidobacteriota bacterium]